MATVFNKLNTNQAGTNLGAEDYAWTDQASGGSRDASATITFNTNGTVTFAGTGDLVDFDSSPTTNWNINGGSYLSYETLIISSDVGGTATVTGGLATSTFLGENRHNLGASNFVLSASATLPVGEQGFRTATVYIKVSIWDAASGGRRTAYGLYNAGASAGAF